MIIHELNEVLKFWTLWACLSIKGTLSHFQYNLEWLSDHRALEGHIVLQFQNANDLLIHCYPSS